MTTAAQRRSMVFPLLLILLGVYWLAYNLGWVTWSPWRALFTLWPVILIAIGLDILLARANPWVSVAVGLLFLIGVVVLLLLVSVFHVRGRVRPRPLYQEISVPLDHARQARLYVKWTGGRLRLQSAPAPVDTFLTGDARLSRTRGLAVARSRTDDQLEVRIRPTAPLGVWSLPRTPLGEADLSLDLHPDIPTQLEADLDLVESKLDLRDTHVAALDLELDLGRGTVILPADVTRGQARFTVDLGRLELVIPPTVAAQVRLEGGLIGRVVRNPRLLRTDRGYRTADYATAEHRWDVRIDADLARVVLR